MSPPRQRRTVQPHLVALGAALRHAREAARPQLSGKRLAEALSWDQGKVSRIESGRQVPTEGDVAAWAAVVNADATALLLERERALVRNLDTLAAARLPGGVEALQGDLGTLESGSDTIAEYQVDVIPGLAQIPAYTRDWLNQPDRVELAAPPDVEQTVAGRQSRQRNARGRHVTIAVRPSALTAVYGSVAVQRDQLEQLAAASERGDVELLVATQPLAIMQGFELLDALVFVETDYGGRVFGDPAVVAQYRAALERVRRTGLTGHRASVEVRRAKDSLNDQ